ncbi:MAG: thermonuclease family protein [Thermodesulfobacteriota bacterium]
MDRNSLVYWLCIAGLLSASLFYGFSTEKVRRSVLREGGKIENGSIVSLVRVIDGDTVLAAQEGQKPATIRILGIKTFDTKIEKDIGSPYGKSAMDLIELLTRGRPIRVLLHSTPKDRHGRTIAVLYADEQDVGLRLIRDGLALVYTVYPFPAMSLYLNEQDLARNERRGLWANSEVAARAMTLFREWQGRSQ